MRCIVGSLLPLLSVSGHSSVSFCDAKIISPLLPLMTFEVLLGIIAYWLLLSLMFSWPGFQAGLTLGLSCASEPQYVFDNAELWESQPVENIATTVTVGSETRADVDTNEAQVSLAFGALCKSVLCFMQTDFYGIHFSYWVAEPCQCI